MEKVIREFGSKNGYTFIFVKNEGMLFADDKADVTEEVLKLLNASRKK
jgi:outer membrane protein